MKFVKSPYILSAMNEYEIEKIDMLFEPEFRYNSGKTEFSEEDIDEYDLKLDRSAALKEKVEEFFTAPDFTEVYDEIYSDFVQWVDIAWDAPKFALKITFELKPGILEEEVEEEAVALAKNKIIRKWNERSLDLDEEMAIAKRSVALGGDGDEYDGNLTEIEVYATFSEKPSEVQVSKEMISASRRPARPRVRSAAKRQVSSSERKNSCLKCGRTDPDIAEISVWARGVGCPDGDLATTLGVSVGTKVCPHCAAMGVSEAHPELLDLEF